MKVGCPILRSLGMALVLTILGHAAAWGQAAVVQPPKNSSPPSKGTLGPEIEKKLQGIMVQAKKQKHGFWDSQMKKRIDDITQATSLNDDGVKALWKAEGEAVTASTDEWGDKVLEFFHKQLAMFPRDQLLAMLNQVTENQARTGILPMDDGPIAGQFVAPENQDVWTKALHQTLSPTQFDALTQAQSKEKATIEKEIGTILDNAANRMRDQQTNAITSQCKSIEDDLKLPKDRAAQLNAIGKAAVDQTVDKYRKRVEQWLLSVDESQRRPMLANNWYMGSNPDESPMEQPAWKDGLAHFLTDPEQTELHAAQEETKARRERVMGQVMVMLIDEKLALTEAERQKLEPITARLVKDIPELYPKGSPGDYYNITPELFYSATSKVNDTELKPILDAVQLQRWHNLSSAGAPEDSPNAVTVDTPVPSNNDPEDVEKAVSSFFYEKTESERKRELEANTLKAEDVARVAGLNAESSERLQAAARGATEQSLMTWKWFTEQQIRSQLQGLTPQNVNQRLVSLQDLFFQRRFDSGQHQDIWDQTVQTELTDEQQQAWEKEKEARADYRGNAIASSVLAEFDRQAHLSDDQWNKLHPLVANVLADYSPGIAQVFSGMNGMVWYLGGPYVLIPLAGVDDKDLNAVLTKDQVDLWTGSQDFANANNLWQVVKQMRVQRSAGHVQRTARAVIED